MTHNKVSFVGTRDPFVFCSSIRDCQIIENHITNIIWTAFAPASNPQNQMECHVGDCIGVDRIVFEKVMYLKSVGFNIVLIWHRITPQSSLSFYKHDGYDRKVEYTTPLIKARLRERTIGLIRQGNKVVIIGRSRELGRGCSLGLKTARELKIDHDVHFLVKIGRPSTDLFDEVEEESIKRRYCKEL